MIEKMIKLILTLILIINFAAQWTYASNKTINGSAVLEKATLENLIVNGSLDFKDLIIEKKLKAYGSVSGNKLESQIIEVNGAFKGDDVKAENITVNGSFTGNKIDVKNFLTVDGTLIGAYIIVHGKTKVAGVMSISDSELSDIELDSEKSALTNSKVKTISVKNNSKVQKLELRKKTVVFGDVTFESGVGEIYLYDNSEIQGKVKGAIVIKK